MRVKFEIKEWMYLEQEADKSQENINKLKKELSDMQEFDRGILPKGIQPDHQHICMILTGLIKELEK